MSEIQSNSFFIIPIRQIIWCDLAYQIATVVKGTVIYNKKGLWRKKGKKNSFGLSIQIRKFLSNSSRVSGFFFFHNLAVTLGRILSLEDFSAHSILLVYETPW